MPTETDSFSFWRPWLVLRQRGKLIVMGTLVCGFTALIFSLLQPKIYRAVTYLLVSESRLADSNSPSAGHVYYELLRSYETFLNNDYLIEKTVQHFQLGKSPYHLTHDGFKRRRILQVELSKNSRLLQVSIEFPDPVLAAEIANFFARSAAAFNEEMNAQDVQKTRQSFLKEDLEESSKNLETAGRTLLAFNQSSRLEELRETVSNLQEENTRAKAQLVDMKIELSRLLATRQKLAEEKPQANQGADHSTSDNRADRRSAISETDPSFRATRPGEHPVSYSRLDMTNLAEVDAEIAGLQAGTDYLERTLQKDQQRLSAVSREKVSKETTLEQLTLAEKQARENHSSLVRKYQEASANASAHSTNLKLIAPAIAPEKPVKPNIFLNTLIALALGMFLSSFLVLGWHQVKLSTAQESMEPQNNTEERIKEIKHRVKGVS